MNASLHAALSLTTPTLCKPKSCEVGGGGLFLPLFGDAEQRWQKLPLRAILYMCGLLWCFMGVAIVSDIFMESIEKITSKKARVMVKGKWTTVKVWNDTVANLTLMALGSSAPEILLSVIELCSNKFLSGDLGPSTIVGSAAFNLLCISAVCVMAIPDGEVRKIKDTGVFAITAGFSVFAYLWLYFIVLINSPDEIDIFEGVLTFLFFPILVALAFAADKGHFKLPGGDPDAHEGAPRCRLGHEIEWLSTTRDNDGWGCDGRFSPGGCRSGITGFHQSKGVDRYRCEQCDYDLCRKCVEHDHKQLRKSRFVGSGSAIEKSHEELASIELRILQEHGDALSDEQVARLIHKLHEEPSSRAAYRVNATRQMIGGAKPKSGPDSSDDHNSYALTAIVPMDDSRFSFGGSPLHYCKNGHTMHGYVTNKANFNCDICQQRFPAGATLYGCRTCNFDACADCKSGFVKADAVIEFASPFYTVMESVGTLRTQVVRTGDELLKVSVHYKTRNGTAIEHEDYIPLEGVLVFDEGEVTKEIAVQIVDDSTYEDDEEFYMDLFSPSCSSAGVKVSVGEYSKVTIQVVDDDLPGILFFAEESMYVTESIDNQVITITVKRRDGSNGKISCKYTTEGGSAVAGAGYLAISGTLELHCGQMSADIQLTILSGHHYDMKQEFRLIISDPAGGAKFDPSTDGGEDTCVCTIVTTSDEAARGRTNRVMEHLVDWDKAQVGTKNWSDQFWCALLVNGGEDDEPPSTFDYIMHVITIFWKVIFSIIPPTDFCDGRLCFACSLAMIGAVTAVIGDLASLLGCTLDVPDKITAITFVALGTSLPDTFASKTAAEQDPHADASIGNITGSNSVNVFLGLGLPWVMGSIYWKMAGKTNTWKEEYRVLNPELLVGPDSEGRFIVLGGDLGISVAIFSCCAILAIGGLVVRRKLYGGELGGPSGPKKATAVGLVSLWFIYIGLSSYVIMSNLSECAR